MDRPAIIVYVKDLEESILNAVLYGIEEESIPYHVEQRVFSDAAQTAYEASLSSPLNVGIGYFQGTLCLHHKSLKRAEPYQKLEHVSIIPSVILKNFGSNAARIVKNTPLKSLEILEVNQ